MIDKRNVEDIYPLAPLQESMLIHSLSEDRSSVYVIQQHTAFRGSVNVDALVKSWEEFGKRHDIGRKVFSIGKARRPLQIVLRERPFPCEVSDLQGRDPAVQRSAIESFKREDLHRGFDPARDPLIRMAIFVLNAERVELIITVHHIVMDAWSMSILQEELIECYRGFVRGTKIPAGRAAPYSQYVSWLEAQDKEAAKAYWRSTLQGYEEKCSIPALDVSKDKSGFLKTIFEVDESSSAGLRALAERNGITLSSVLQTLWGTVLAKYNGKSDALFGAITSNRPAEVPGSDRMVGLFINTLPVRVAFEPGQSFSELCRKVHAQFSESCSYGYLPLGQVFSAASLNRDLVDFTLNFESAPGADGSELSWRYPDLGFELDQVGTESHSEVDFALYVFPVSRIGFQVVHNTARYSENAVRKVFRHFERVCRQVLENPDVCVTNVELVTPEEKELVVNGFNATAAEFPRDSSIVALFEEQVRRTPHAPALVFENVTWTYDQLNREANKYAHYLLSELDLRPDDLVALMVDRSERMIAALFAILKTGAAFVPIDPSYPAERVKHMLSASGCKAVIASSPVGATFLSHNLPVFALPDMIGDTDTNPARPIPATSLVYTIFTSGSTGQPKGAMIEHRGLVNNIHSLIREFSVTPDDRCLQFATLAFDFSMSEIFVPLLAGGTLVLISRETIDDTDKFIDYLNEHNVTLVKLPPAYLGSLNKRPLGTVKKIVCAGEPARVDDVSFYSSRTQFFNEYGPTECSVCATVFPVSPGYSFGTRVPIGKPLSNYQLYVLDEHRNVQPIGVPGEIYISGVGVARGYISNPALTDERFLDSPFVAGARLYRTGDIGCWLPDGTIDCFGRKDHQVKIRGYRVELGEIEAAAMSHPAVSSAAAILSDDELVGFYTAAGAAKAEELKTYLRGILPAYMVPSRLLEIPSLPLTPNGKVDRGALSRRAKDISAGTGAEPRTEMEKALAALWGRVLPREEIGIDDDFFEIGGDSIKAITLAAGIRSELSSAVNVSALFQAPTIRELARRIDEESGKDLVTFNPNGSKTLVCLPPLAGFGLVYKGLSRYLRDTRLLCLDFVPGDPVKRCVEAIKSHKLQEPLVLFGYSSGGNLAFEVAKSCEMEGIEVEEIILADSWKREELFVEDETTARRKVQENRDAVEKIAGSMADRGFLEQVQTRIEKYLSYLATLRNLGTVRSKIHLIQAGSIPEDPRRAAFVSQNWSAATQDECVVYQGTGGHDEMFDEPYIADQAEIIGRILRGWDAIESCSQEAPVQG